MILYIITAWLICVIAITLFFMGVSKGNTYLDHLEEIEALRRGGK